MAYRRITSIIARSKLLQQPRFSPSISHISSNSSDREEFHAKTLTRNSEYPSRFLRYNAAANSPLLSGNVSGLMRSNIPAGHGLLFHRNFSKVPSDVEVVSEGGGDLMGAVVDKAVETAAPVVNEVAVAAADSFAPVAAFQYLIDYVHSVTGFQWWASIAATALLIHFIQLPAIINSLKYSAGYSYHNRYMLMSVIEVATMLSKLIIMYCLTAKGPWYRKRTCDESNTTKFFREVPILLHIIPHVTAAILFFAILNMAEKVPSFRTGGILWFTDLTTRDRMYFPILFALILWIRLELNTALTTSNRRAIKFNSALILGVSAGAVAAGLPSAIYCYFITSNLFYIAFSIALWNPEVMKLLRISVKPPSTGK